MRCSNCGAENPEGLKFCNRAAVRGSSSLAVLTIWLLTPSQSIRLKKSRRSPILPVGSNKTVMNKEGNSCGSLLHHTYWTKSSYGEVPAREVGRDGALIAILTQSFRQAPLWAVRLDCFHPGFKLK
jgi:hypothetical protein